MINQLINPNTRNLTFGKFRGREVIYAITIAPDYMRWCVGHITGLFRQMTEYEVALLKAYIHFRDNHSQYTGHYNPEECIQYARKWLDRNKKQYSKTIVMQKHVDNKTSISFKWN